MLFDKLWVRIKGELLTFREDFPGAEEIREKGESLLRKLERQWGELRKVKDEPGPGNAEAQAHSEKEIHIETSSQDIEREWDELMKLRDEKKRDCGNSEIKPPNPRTLG
jgi:hypothetical protein